VEKYGRARQATDDNIIRCKLFACWINKATNKHSEYGILLAVHGNFGYANVPHIYVIPVFPLFLKVK
jgi:hypothetical protein